MKTTCPFCEKDIEIEPSAFSQIREEAVKNAEVDRDYRAQCPHCNRDIVVGVTILLVGEATAREPSGVVIFQNELKMVQCD